MLEAFMNKELYIKLTEKDKPLLPELKEIIGLDWKSGADFVTQTPRFLSADSPAYITVCEERTGIVVTWDEPGKFVDAETFVRESKLFELDQNQYEKVWEYELN